MVLGMTTQATCGAVCWYAKEPDCRCSCGGTSHGVMNTGGDGIPPRRNCMILGTRYVLGAVTFTNGWHYKRDFAREWAIAHPEERTRLTLDATNRTTVMAPPPLENEKRAVLQNKLATAQQAEKWPEVQASQRDYMERARIGVSGHRPTRAPRPRLVWVREDAADAFDAWQAAGEPRR